MRNTFCAVAVVLLVSGLAQSAKADTVYTYTGNDYTGGSGSYSTGGPYALSITFDTTLTGSALDNLTNADITSDITSFDMTDGSGLTINQGTSALGLAFVISTDATGQITAWQVFDQIATYAYVESYYIKSSGFATDVSYNPATGGGDNDNDPGSWTSSVVTTTPEPSTSSLLFGAGLLGLLGLAAKGKRHAPAASC